MHFRQPLPDIFLLNYRFFDTQISFYVAYELYNVTTQQSQPQRRQQQKSDRFEDKTILFQ